MFRLYAADTPAVAAVIDQSPLHELGCTVFHASGFWRGVREDSVIVEADQVDLATMEALAREIVAACGEESVMISEIPTVTRFVTRKEMAA